MNGKRGWERHTVALACLLGVALRPGTGEATPLDAVQADRMRIQDHLSRVEAQLRRTPVETLTSSARAERARLLDELQRYWQAGVFPRNSQHPFERRPYFIDDAGRACAVGALIQRSGHQALAERIDQQFHTDYVPDMPDAELLAWAETHGFSVAELSLIQPTYCDCDGYNGGFGPESGGAGGALTVDGADYYQPVCGSNGLTYWNECIAEVCGGVTVAAAGECEREPPCELCGTGSKYVVVSECGMTGICNGIDSQPDIVPVGEAVGVRWLELQAAACQDPNYDLPGYDEHDGWQAARPVYMEWQCYDGGESSGGQPPTSDAGAASSGAGKNASSGGVGGAPDTEVPATRTDPHPSGGGCASAGSPQDSWASFGMGVVVLALLRRRRASCRN